MEASIRRWLSKHPLWGSSPSMSVRLGEGMGGNVERWRTGLSGPEPAFDPYASAGLTAPEQPPDPYATEVRPAEAEYRAAVHSDAGGERDRYDEEYDYYWGDIRLPLWIALILQVPWRQRLDIFVIGFIVGLVIAGVAVTWGLLLSRY